MSNPMCKCYSQVAYRVTAADIPESDPETFIEYDVYESCGQETSGPKREFRPGHDAKLKSVLQKAIREDEGYFAYVESGMLIHASAMELAKARGWEKFMTAAPKRKSRAKTKVANDATDVTGAVNQAPEPVEVQGFRPARVKVGRWWKDGSIVSETNESVVVEYTDRKGNAQQVEVERTSDKLEIG
jgi:hypothetical protein